ncbi:MAG: bifunctional oligoribonuclease/PAP phosphatase NrnA [Lachnospiraceae bacterium]|nr:bifunctional oligoribonuclease/PAP phosphatase NrnA [Lachnospiraceae bacterium]
MKQDFLKKIEQADSIAIIGHIRPDGDCVGSCLGLYNYIMDVYPDKKAVVFLQQIADKFVFLRGSESICNVPQKTVFDLAVSLDCGDTDRHGEFAMIFSSARDTICLDHHRSNQGFGNLFYCDEKASSTCEVLYRFLDEDKIMTECAECLYLGIVHDTGVFKYPSTKEETMQIAGTLITKGARSQFIIDHTFYMVRFDQNRLTGRALLDARLYFEGQVIATCVTEELFREYGCTKADTDGIIDKIRVTEGVEVAIFVYQLTEDTYKYSLRSVSYVDVSKIAVAFGGGGHIRAAGFEAKGPYEEHFTKILDMIYEQL